MSIRNARPRMVDQRLPSAKLETKRPRTMCTAAPNDDPLLSWLRFVRSNQDAHPITPLARYFEPELLRRVGIDPDSPRVLALVHRFTSNLRASVTPTNTRAPGQQAQPNVIHSRSSTSVLQSPRPRAAIVELPLSPEVPVSADVPPPEQPRRPMTPPRPASEYPNIPLGDLPEWRRTQPARKVDTTRATASPLHARRRRRRRRSRRRSRIPPTEPVAGNKVAMAAPSCTAPLVPASDHIAAQPLIDSKVKVESVGQLATTSAPFRTACRRRRRIPARSTTPRPTAATTSSSQRGTSARGRQSRPSHSPTQPALPFGAHDGERLTTCAFIALIAVACTLFAPSLRAPSTHNTASLSTE
ncbi:hypothetical protein PENSPDRAFT_656365 [Peniophora sp. CONT]|nr:hypothetical protein PENSPDRAFT_656365 [Peniophora sp. CONT]